MAIGNKGFYATTQAPNVDFGAMVDKGIDKKLARDAAEQAKRDKAKADEEAKKKKLELDWAEVKQTGRNMYDVSATNYVKNTIKDTQALLRQYDASNDPRERAILEDKIKMNELNVQALASSTGNFKSLIDKVTGNLGNYNSDAVDFFENLMTSVDEGKVRVYSDENGRQMYEVFDTNPNDDIDDSYTIPASDLMKEPMLASNYSAKKKAFVDGVQLEKTDSGGRLKKTTTELKTPETMRQVETFAEQLTNDKAEMFKFFVDEHGGGAKGINAWNNRTDKEYKEYKDKFYKKTVDDVWEAIQQTITTSYGSPSSSGSGTPKINTGNLEVIFGTENDITKTKTGKTIDRGAADGSSFMPVSKSNGDPIKMSDNSQLSGFGRDAKGAFAVLLVKEDKGGSTQATTIDVPQDINGTGGEGQNKAPKIKLNLGDRESDAQTFKRVYVREGNPMFGEAVKVEGYQQIDNKLFNDLVRRKRVELNLPKEDYSDKQVIKIAEGKMNYTAGDRAKKKRNVEEFVNHDDIKSRVTKLKDEGKIKKNATNKEIVDYFKNNVKSVWDKWNKGGKMEKTKPKGNTTGGNAR